MPFLRTPEEIADLRYRRALKKITLFLKNWLYLIIAAVAILTCIGADFGNWNGMYNDADGYMRALRIWHWLLNPSFWEQPLWESDYPFGEVLHWTRPMDILWLVNTLPFLGLDSLKDAVFLGGAFISPWLHVLSAVVLAYGLRRRFNVYLTLFGCLLFLSDPVMQNYFFIGRPDHHSLMALLGIYAVSLNLCWLKKRHARYLALLGISLALAAFTAIEGMILYLLFLGFFVSLYVFRNLSLSPAVKISFWFSAALTLFWLSNPPYEGWLYPDNGRISVLFVTFSWLIFGALCGIGRGRLHTRALKIWSLICATAGILLILLIIFGSSFLHFPLDSEIYSVWSSRISEMRPATRQNWDIIIAVYLFPAASLLAGAALLRYKPYRRIMWLNLTLGVPLFILNLAAIRFSNYLCLYNIMPWLCLLERLYQKSAYARRCSDRFPVSVWWLGLGVMIAQQFLFLPFNINALEKEQTVSYSHAMCENVRRVGGTLITDNFLSPQYVWLCNVNTVGTPYHRNREGLVDTHRILQSTDDKEAVPLLLRHQVTQILLFDRLYRYYDLAEKNRDKLYYRLIKRENIPDWLEEIPAPLPQARHYRIRL